MRIVSLPLRGKHSKKVITGHAARRGCKSSESSFLIDKVKWLAELFMHGTKTVNNQTVKGAVGGRSMWVIFAVLGGGAAGRVE